MAIKRLSIDFYEIIDLLLPQKSFPPCQNKGCWTINVPSSVMLSLDKHLVLFYLHFEQKASQQHLTDEHTLIQPEHCKSFTETELLLLTGIQPHRPSSCTCTSLKQTSFLLVPTPTEQNFGAPEGAQKAAGSSGHIKQTQQTPVDYSSSLPQPELFPCCIPCSGIAVLPGQS